MQDIKERIESVSTISSLKEIAQHALSVATSHIFQEKNYQEGIELILLSLKIKESAELYGNLILFYKLSGKMEEAIEVGKTAVIKYKDNADLWFNYGTVLKDANYLQQAAEALRIAIQLNPDFPMNHYHLSNICFAIGNYEEGLKEEEWRFKAHSGLARFRQRFPVPDWQGEENKTVLVFSEQGLGDAIQNARYIPLIKNKVIFEVQKEFGSLFDEMTETILRDNNEEKPLLFPKYDCAVSVNSLPLYFDPGYKNTDIEPYLFPPKKFPLDFEEFSGYKKVGIVWAGSQWHVEDKYRSCFLKHFAPLFELPNVKIFNLQSGNMTRTWCNDGHLLWEGGDEYEVVNLLEGAEHLIEKMVDFMPFFNDFCDTANLIDQLDLVIAVDTSNVHLAGAMGKKVWLLLPYSHEWRWLKKWYKNLEIFRQKEMGNWKELLLSVTERLKNDIS